MHWRHWFFKPLLVAALVLAAVVVARLSTHTSTHPYISDGKINLNRAISYWKSDIEKRGPSIAHDDMVREGLSISLQLRHSLAHAYGEALYDLGTTSWIVYCKNGEYMFGCYHQFIGLTTADTGQASLKQLKEYCDASQDTSISCAHGIGHATLSARGYTLRDLTNALTECDKLYGDDRDYCADGTFMEYNLKEVQSLQLGSDIKPFDIHNPYDPCDKVAATYRNPCFHQLPLWWRFVKEVASTTPLVPPTALSNHLATHAPHVAALNVYTEMGMLCRALTMSPTMKALCFTDLGYPIAQFRGFNPSAIEKTCAAASDTAYENLLCLSGAARRFLENGLDYSHTCTDLGLTGEQALFCNRFITGTLPEQYAQLSGTPSL